MYSGDLLKPVNIKPGDARTLVPKHRARGVARLVLALLFSPAFGIGVAYAVCRGWFAVGVALTDDLFED